MLNTNYNSRTFGSNNIYHFIGEKGSLYGTVYKVEEKSNNSYQEIRIDATHFQLFKKLHRVNGRVLLRIYDDALDIHFGDTIKAEVLLKEPPLPDNFGEFNYRDYLARDKIFLTGTIKNNKIKIVKTNNNTDITSIIYLIKNSIENKINKLYQSNQGSLIKAIIIGDRSGISKELAGIFQDSGIMHLLAISGLHVGIIAMALFFILSAIPEDIIKKIYKYLIIVIILAGYTAMTGFRPSVCRAALMFSLVIISKSFGRPYHIYNSLYLSALLILLWNPLYISDAGFLLSFIVTFFIISIAPILENRLDFLPSYLAKSFSLSLSAWLGIAPLSAYFFYKISFIAIIANIVIIPLTGVVLILSLISIVMSYLSLNIASIFSLINEFFIALLIMIGKKLSLLPFAYRYIAQPEIISVILYYIIILLFFYTLHFWSDYNYQEKQKKSFLIISFTLIFLFVNILYTSSLLEVHFINVGQGDCIFIQTPGKENILIDGGGTVFNDYDVGKNKVIPYLRRKGIQKIDMMFLTHPDLDHLEGLVSILKEMSVDKVFDTELTCESMTYLEFLSLIQENKDISYYKIKAGDIIEINKNLNIFVLNPDKSNCYSSEADFNNNSIVLKLQYKNANFLFTGDIEKEIEVKLLSEDICLESDILKVAHHGSSSSSYGIFLETVNPEVAVISVGDNNFGHPDSDVVNRLENVCQRVFRTDLNGTILVKSDGNKYYINTLR